MDKLGKTIDRCIKGWSRLIRKTVASFPLGGLSFSQKLRAIKKNDPDVWQTIKRLGHSRGQRHWDGKGKQQLAVYENRRRVNGAYGKRLLRKRGELIERSFAHCYDAGGMRRTHLRGHQNILKRLLIHVGAFNLSLIFRRLLGSGTPREWKNRHSSLLFALLLLFRRYTTPKRRTTISFSWPHLRRPRNQRYLRYRLRHSGERRSATDC